MTKRKPRRKAPQKAGRPIGWAWWAAGILAVGWFVFDANRAAVLDHVPQLAALMGGTDARTVAVKAPAAPRLETAARRADPQRADPLRTGSLRQASPAVQTVAAVPTRSPATTINRPAPAAIAPKARPGVGVAAIADAQAVTSRRTPLRRAPSADAPAWATLEPGRPVRVTALKGSWRRVEAGIFTGWIEAEAMETRPAPAAMPARSVLAEVKRGQPVPPGAIPAR